MIKNDRIRIYPASREQMESFITAEKDDELKKAYSEMLEGCLAHPEEWDWYAMWMIEKMDGTHIGDLCFKGIGADHNPEIGYWHPGRVSGTGLRHRGCEACAKVGIRQYGSGSCGSRIGSR